MPTQPRKRRAAAVAAVERPLAPPQTPEQPRSWLPSRKWYAQVTGGVAAIVASWIVTGVFDDVERGMAGALLTAAVASYWTPNAK